MRICTLLLVLVTGASAQAGPMLPTLVELRQDKPRAHHGLKIPEGHTVGPTIPGLRKGQGAVPQGLVYWQKQKWFLISCYFPDEEGHPSVVVALDEAGKLVRCLTLVEATGKAHTQHVGGLAVSDKYLWVGSGLLYRVPLTAILAAKSVDYLPLQTPFKAECTASYVAYHDKQVWVGEFVSREHDFEGSPAHKLKDRNGVQKYAWIAGYALDGDDDLKGTAGDKHPPPAAVLSVRQKVQGMAFLGDSILLSMSYGRKNNSTLAAYTNPLQEKRHGKVEVGSKTVPVWFLDGQNNEWERDDYPPMSEGITAYGKRFGLIFESGAEKYEEDSRGSIDTILFFKPPAGK